MPDTIVFLIAGIVVLLFASWAGWHVGGWRGNTKPPILPDRVWLCDACSSFNDPTHATCYRCHRPRPADAREIEPDPEFHIDQQLGRSKSSLDWGASSPWLAALQPSVGTLRKSMATTWSNCSPPSNGAARAPASPRR